MIHDSHRGHCRGRAHAWLPVLLALVVLSASAAPLRASDPGPAALGGAVEADPATPATTTRAAAAYRQHLPLVAGRPPLSHRLGFGRRATQTERYGEIGTLKAGWYVDWTLNTRPLRQDGIEFAQLISLHQKLDCRDGAAARHDRSVCPYAVPHTYTSPAADSIAAAARANPGSLWLVGNEMDRRDWPGGGQDEMLPETYAVAYHDMYTILKAADPTARVAVGGVIQATPLRLEYLTKVWDTYRQRYGVVMPVDVWNVHNFIMKERLNDYGASIPPGSSAQVGVEYLPYQGGDNTHVSMTIFDNQIREFRKWMRDRGQQNKPLIVSEYGVLYSHISDADTPQEVQRFMLATFDYFLNTRDCGLGYPADECRLVQRWAWYSLDDDGRTTGFNPYAALFDPVTRQITPAGAAFRDYSRANLPRLAR